MIYKENKEKMDIRIFPVIMPEAITTLPSKQNIIVESFTFFNIFCMSKAITSVPPVAQSCLNAIPMAVPTSRLPAIDAINKIMLEGKGKLVISMKGMSCIQIGVNNVIYNVLIPKFLPRNIVARINRGMDIHSVIIDTGICVIVANIIDRPVIPPGANVVEAKKKFTAIAVKIAEKLIPP